MGCKACAGLKRVLEERFAEHDVELRFIVSVYEQDPDGATHLCGEYGLDDIPSFWINGTVFKVGFSEQDVKNSLQPR